MNLIRYTFSELSAGMADSIFHTVTQEDIERFADVTGDRNPIHLDEEFARGSRFGKTVAHGMFGAGLISALLGGKLPGPGSVYMEQTLRFKKPVFAGDTLVARAQILELNPEKHIVRLSTVCTNQHGATVIEGEALLLHAVA